MLLNIVLAPKMRHGRLILPALFISASINARVNKVLDTILERLIYERLTLLLFEHRLFRCLYREDAPDRLGGGGCCCRLEEGREVSVVALDDFDERGLLGKLLCGGRRGIARHAEDSV